MRVQPKAKPSTQTRHQQDQEVHVLSSSEEIDKHEPEPAVYWDRLRAGQFATAGRSGKSFYYNTNIGYVTCE